jgi:hypothetical protein
MIDSGADISILKKQALTNLRDVNTLDNVFISGISSKHVKTIGSTIKNFSVQDNNFAHKFYIVDERITIDFDGILGNDFFVRKEAKIDYKKNILEFIIGNIEFTIPFFETRSVNLIRKDSRLGVNGDKGPVEVKNPFWEISPNNNNRSSQQQEDKPSPFLRPAGSRTDIYNFEKGYDEGHILEKDASDKRTIFTERKQEKSTDMHIQNIKDKNSTTRITEEIKNEIRNEKIKIKPEGKDSEQYIKDEIRIYTKNNEVKIIPGSKYPEDKQKDKKEEINKIRTGSTYPETFQSNKDERIPENKYSEENKRFTKGKDILTKKDNKNNKIEEKTRRVTETGKIVEIQNTINSNMSEQEKKDIKKSKI